jgi:hypothetical protein
MRIETKKNYKLRKFFKEKIWVRDYWGPAAAVFFASLLVFLMVRLTVLYLIVHPTFVRISNHYAHALEYKVSAPVMKENLCNMKLYHVFYLNRWTLSSFIANQELYEKASTDYDNSKKNKIKKTEREKQRQQAVIDALTRPMAVQHGVSTQ